MDERGHHAVGIDRQVFGPELIELEQVDILAFLPDALLLERHAATDGQTELQKW
ncbi:MAG TPA: hypothetical protein VNF99_15935 [Stellaceae bacterium]|nr:hypothetical protein [Stellaceae bacterium]